MAHVHLTCTNRICTCHFTTNIPCIAHATHANGRRVGSAPGRRTVYASLTDCLEGTTNSAHSHTDMLYRMRVVAMLLRALCLEMYPSNIAIIKQEALAARTGPAPRPTHPAHTYNN